MVFTDRQLALALAVFGSPNAATAWTLSKADKYLEWLDFREEPPDVTWVETGPVTDKIQDT